MFSVASSFLICCPLWNVWLCVIVLFGLPSKLLCISPILAPIPCCKSALMHAPLSPTLLLVSVWGYPITSLPPHHTQYSLSPSALSCISPCSLVPPVQSEVHSVAEPPAAQRDDSPMDVDQPSPLEQEQAVLGEALKSVDVPVTSSNWLENGRQFLAWVSLHYVITEWNINLMYKSSQQFIIKNVK